MRAKLAAGEVRDINDLITYNLDIRQFAQDVIETCEGSELLRAFWQAITRVTVLDPTCGSGAFLFAALNILQPLYEACLERMEGFIADLERSGEKHRPEKFGDFRKALAEIEAHPNERYAILKAIVVNNLYGVDIMEEAVEICKLRLFLKLVAQVDDAAKIEPLPDIDFNIRAGNTLVGFATRDEVKRAITAEARGGGNAQAKLLSTDDLDTLARIEEKAGDLERLFDRFREQQAQYGGRVTPADKGVLRERLKAEGIGRGVEPLPGRRVRCGPEQASGVQHMARQPQTLSLVHRVLWHPQARRIIAMDPMAGRVWDLSQPRWDAVASLTPDGQHLLLWTGRGGFWLTPLVTTTR